MVDTTKLIQNLLNLEFTSILWDFGKLFRPLIYALLTFLDPLFERNGMFSCSNTAICLMLFSGQRFRQVHGSSGGPLYW